MMNFNNMPWLNPDTGIPAGGFANATGVANPFMGGVSDAGMPGLGGLLSLMGQGGQQMSKDQSPAPMTPPAGPVGAAPQKAVNVMRPSGPLYSRGGGLLGNLMGGMNGLVG